MEQAQNYLRQFRSAATAAERQQIADAYIDYFDTLSAAEQQQARQIMRPLRADIQQSLDELDQLSEEFNRLLAVKAY